MTRTVLLLPMVTVALALLTGFATLARQDDARLADHVTQARAQAAQAEAAMAQANREVAHYRSIEYQLAQAARHGAEQP